MKGAKKASMLSRQRNIIIVAAIVFAILLTVYLAVVRPMLATDDDSEAQTKVIWKSEQSYLLFEEIKREDIELVKIHNPKNEGQFLDWGFFVCNEEGQKTADGYELVKGETYLLGYEYAPYDENSMANLATDARFTVFQSRLVDHCDDETFESFGLITTKELEAYANASTEEEKAAILEKYAYYTITTTDGRSHTVVIGDKIASGSSNYVRVIDEDVCLETNETMYRDSVYVVKYNMLTGTPLTLVTTLLGYPTDPQNASSYFNDFLIADMKIKLDEQGNPVVDENGAYKYDETKPRIKLTAMSLATKQAGKKDAFSQFASMVSYKVTYPTGGYYGSSSFDELFNYMAEMSGEQVVALGKLMTGVDEKTGEEYSYIGFEDETFAKFGLDKDMTIVFYTYDITPTIDDDDPIETYINISPLQADGYYYAYSMLYNTICRVSPETFYFLDWDVTTYLQTEIFQMKIDNSAKIEISGTYFDFTTGDGLPAGLRDVNLTFSLTETVGDLVVNGADNLTGKSAECDTDNFRELYKLLLQVYLKEEVSEDARKEALANDPYATVKIVTRDQPVYKTDESGNETSVIDHYLYSVTRTFRFYRLSNGRCLCTIQDTYFKTDENGNIVYETDANGKKVPVELSTAENGTFYVVTSRIEQVVEYAQLIFNGVEVDANERR